MTPRFFLILWLYCTSWKYRLRKTKLFARKHMIKQEILCIDQHHHMDWWVREAALFADASN